MSIEIGSKWVKDGEVVEIKYIELAYDVVCIFFDNDAYHVLAEYDFLEQYKPYEPVYEYKYAFANISQLDSVWFDSTYFKDEIEIGKSYLLNTIKYQRIDFTKRERKQK